MVEAALVGLDRRELVTMPSLPDMADWQAYTAARLPLGPNLSRQHAAEHYTTMEHARAPMSSAGSGAERGTSLWIRATTVRTERLAGMQTRLARGAQTGSRARHHARRHHARRRLALAAGHAARRTMRRGPRPDAVGRH